MVLKKIGIGYSIVTLGSHSALQILKGAKEEGFKSIAICEKGRDIAYRKFKVADEIILLDSFKDYFKIEERLRKERAILIPHGSFVVVFDKDIEKLKVPYYGNKRIIKWESDRELSKSWLEKAKLKLPKIFKRPKDIDRPCIIKFYGASGGKGYFIAKNEKEFYEKIKAHKGKRYIIQEYIIGVPIYMHFFYSLIHKELELMGFDRRYESNVDSIGRIAAKDQLDMGLDSSYNIVGNLPIVIRESLLTKVFEMGQNVVEVSQKLEPPGLFGPFCLETVITPDLEFYCFEISARIVAGTNLFTTGSPYTQLVYNENMSTGRRIAREIKEAIKLGRLREVLS